jgi:chromosomal replication initiation ATPase DnaA
MRKEFENLSNEIIELQQTKLSLINDISYLMEEKIVLTKKGMSDRKIALVVAKTVQRHHNLTLTQIQQKSREHKFVASRLHMVALLSRYTDLSTTAIGRVINRSHATVLHSRKNHEDYMDTSPAYRKEYGILDNEYNESLTRHRSNLEPA